MLKKILLTTLLIVISLFVYFFIARPYEVIGDCMEPAIRDGQHLFVNHLYYKFNVYKTGDIIMYRHEDKIWFSRIVGLENQEIKIIEGAIVLDNKIYSDSIQRNWQDWQFGHFALDHTEKIPANHVYVLSDNLSAHHDDSRVFGPIASNNILGKVW